MSKTADILERMRNNPKNIRFEDLEKVCDQYFEKRSSSGSHRTYKTPWIGDPRVNIQRQRDGKAKAFQVRQVLQAIEKLERSK